MRFSLIVLFFLAFYFTSRADIRLPVIFSDHMVLQRNSPIAIWGWAGKQEKINIRFHGQSKTVVADKSGHWKIFLEPESAGGPFILTVKGKNLITVSDILVGEVWVCSGQSNMEFRLKTAMNAEEEINAANYPQIREINVPRRMSFGTQEDILPTIWQVCTPATAGQFSAVAYFFARKLYQELKVPIGLIHSSWGGTNVETWTSISALKKDTSFARKLATVPPDLAVINKMKLEAIINMIKNFQHGQLSTKNISQWKDAAYDDSNWSVLQAPAFWESQGLVAFDGVVWYRKTIDLTAAQAGQPVVLSLAMIDDTDESFVNGIKVGQTVNDYQRPRKYKLAPGILKSGKNVIAVKVTDTNEGGGIYGAPETMKLLFDSLAPISLAGDWKARVDTSAIQYTTGGPNVYPSLVFNGMLEPLIPYTIQGAIWYQGESNAGRAWQYRASFPLLINDWRSRWKQGDFPFYFVQISSFNASFENGLTGSKWAELREAQAHTISLPNTGMAVTTDIGNPDNVHPVNKQDVGLRLALNALHGTYGQKIEFSGPLYQSAELRGKEMVLSFSHTGSGLLVKDKYGYLNGFQVAGNDQQFKWAKAWLDGGKVVVYNDEIEHPVAVRYGWTDDASETNLYNKEGLPASPFRTDSWKLLTVDARYSVLQ